LNKKSLYQKYDTGFSYSENLQETDSRLSNPQVWILFLIPSLFSFGYLVGTGSHIRVPYHHQR